MKNLISTAKTVIVLGAIAVASVGCKQATTPAPIDTAATAPVTATAAHDSGATSAHGNKAATHTSAVGSSKAGATGAGMGAAESGMKERPAVRNNTGETQGTTPGTSLPVSDGSR